MSVERETGERPAQKAFQNASHDIFLPKYLSRLLHDSFCLSGNSLLAPLVAGEAMIGQEAFLLMMFYQDRFAPWASQFGNNESIIIDLEDSLHTALSERYVSFVTEVDGFILALVCCPVGFNPGDEAHRADMLNDCRGTALEITSSILKRHNMQIKCLASDFITSIGQLSSLYDKMYGMWEFRKFFQGGRPAEVFTMVTPTRDTMLETHQYCYDSVARLCALIREGARGEAIDNAQGILDYLAGCEPPTMDGFRLRMQGFVTNMQNALVANNVLAYPSQSGGGSLSHLIYSKNYSALRLSLSEWIGQLFDAYTANERDFNITEIMKYIDNNIRHLWLSVQAVSDEFQISPSLLSTQFKLKAGQRPIDYIHTKRLELAIDLFRTTDLTVKDVSVAVGYGSVATMNRAFKKYKNATPTWFKTGSKS